VTPKVRLTNQGGQALKNPLSGKGFGHESHPSKTDSGWPVCGGWLFGVFVLWADWDELESERYLI
jgi:hypothetical protein